MITLLLPIRLVSEANSRGHWSIKAKRTKKQRSAAYYCCLEANVNSRAIGEERLKVTLTNVTKHTLMDDDNLRSSFKAVRDGIADALGVNDNDPRIEWAYDQRQAKTNAVEVDFVGGNIAGVLFRERLESAGA